MDYHRTPGSSRRERAIRNADTLRAMAPRPILTSSAAALLAASCAAPMANVPSTRSPDLPPAPIASLSAPPPVASSSAITAAAEPPLIEPAPIPSPGCTFEYGEGELNGALELQLDGHPIGQLGGKVSSLKVQVSRDATLATVQVVNKDLELRADVRPNSLEVAQVSGAAPIAEWIELRHGQLTRCADGKATVRFRLPSSVHPSAAASPAELEVRQLTLLEVDRSAGGKLEFLKQGAKTPLRLAPAGKVVAEVVGDPPGQEPRMLSELTVFERKGNLARVRIEGSESDAVGWINASALESASSMFGMLGALGGTGEEQRLVCPEGAKLLARAGNGVWRVGAVRPGGEVKVLPGRDGSFVVVLETGPFFGGLGLAGASRQQVPPGELFLPREEAQRCNVKPAPAPKKP